MWYVAFFGVQGVASVNDSFPSGHSQGYGTQSHSKAFFPLLCVCVVNVAGQGHLQLYPEPWVKSNLSYPNPMGVPTSIGPEVYLEYFCRIETGKGVIFEFFSIRLDIGVSLCDFS